MKLRILAKREVNTKAHLINPLEAYTPTHYDWQVEGDIWFECEMGDKKGIMHWDVLRMLDYMNDDFHRHEMLDYVAETNFDLPTYAVDGDLFSIQEAFDYITNK